MGALIQVRSESADDRAAITDLVRRTYADVAWSDHREHLMIDRLRRSEAFIPMLSLVAEIDREAVGHLLLTRAWIGTGVAASATLALAPLSIVPERQNRGIGSALVHEAHRRALTLGFKSVICVGDPIYYSRFGYQPLANYPITLPFKAPTENQMILPLMPRALHSIKGVIQYHEGWLNH